MRRTEHAQCPGTASSTETERLLIDIAPLNITAPSIRLPFAGTPQHTDSKQLWEFSVHPVVEQTLSQLITSETYSGLNTIIEDLSRHLGYPYYGYQYWPGTAEYGDPEFSGVVQVNYPEAWQRRYVEQDYYQDDPVHLYGVEREGVIEWSHIPRRNSYQEAMMRDAAHHGLEEGIVANFRENVRGRLQLTFAGAAYEGDHRLASEMMPLLVPVMMFCFRRAHKLEEKLKWLTEGQRDVFLRFRSDQHRETMAGSLSPSVLQNRHSGSLS